jgi:hypothetical protein
MRAHWAIVLGGVAAFCAATATRASVEISSAPTRHMRCSAGVCTPTHKRAVLNAADLAIMLATSDVKVATGGDAVTITVTSSFSWTSASRLTLDAALNVSFAAPVSVAGPGGLSIVYDDGGTGGDLHFSPGAKVDFLDLGSSLTINGNAYFLESSIASLAHDAKHNPSSYYALAADYDASADTAWPIPGITGTFEGLGHQISNMTLTDAPSERKKPPPPDYGLFVYASGTIRDLSLTHVVFSLQNTPRKALFAPLTVTLAGTVENVSADVQIAMNGHSCGASGLVGYVNGWLKNSSSSGSITGCRGAAGLVLVNYGTVSQSSSSVSIIGQGSGGGIAGLVGDNLGTIEQSHATGSMSGGRDSCGLVDQDYLSKGLIQSYATGNVSGSEYAGGLTCFSGAPVSDSYATGAVSGGVSAGGLVAVTGDGAQIVDSYATGAVSGSGTLGGIIGMDQRRSTDGDSDVYWDLDTSGIGNPAQGAGNIANDPGLTGLSDAQLKSGLPTGFDPSLWAQQSGTNNGYPYLIDNPPQ